MRSFHICHVEKQFNVQYLSCKQVQIHCTSFSKKTKTKKKKQRSIHLDFFIKTKLQLFCYYTYR